ncbi:hypothetical protein [uncultured Shewanella sp.]|uniref:hypothetical protein n=1 Tax=uncultured Shewanella sp. TaxID=173975 RepID=UPI00261FC4A4|nr:hypothetical protein [uncultured Shewanella sp.]
MVKLYIHIGSHKTGSTTIQHGLKEKSKDGMKEGWRYVKTPKCVKQLMWAHEYNTTLVDNFKKALKKNIKLHNEISHYVMSSEFIMGNPDNGYKNSAIAAKILRKATEEYDVSIIIYLRRQDDFVESMYTQNIHQGRTIDFNTFFEAFKVDEALDYRRILNDFELEFDKENLIVKSYHAASKVGLLNDFSEVIGSRLLLESTRKRSNPSYSKSALEIARICNPHLHKKDRRKMRTSLQASMMKKKEESFSFLSPDLREKFLIKYIASNKAVSERFFGGDLSRLFPLANNSVTEETPAQITNEQVATLILNILKKEDKENLFSRVRKFLASLRNIKLNKVTRLY